MFRRSCAVIAHKTTHLAKRLAQPLSKRKLLHAARVIGPTLVALTFAGVAHAQGTMDFSGAQTLMGTFKTRGKSRDAAINTLTGMVGAMVLARAIGDADDELSREILRAARKETADRVTSAALQS